MSIQFSAGQLKGQERKEIIQAVQKRMQEAALAAIRLLLTQCYQQEVTAKLGCEKGMPRRPESQVCEID